MKLSTKGRYAITAMMELALRHKQGPVTLADISVEQSISVSYLEQLFALLRKHGLVTGLRGPGGGYCLRRPASEISIADILRAVDESVEAAAHAEPATVSETRGPSLVLWDQLSHQIYDYLDSISLAQAITQKEAISAPSDKAAGGSAQRIAAA
ncbi:MAG: Rrf2 family transcriptional regulator [Gammaproteobacteria bacterium]|jgi:Rrf2 family iron-sulfur cluster assembly transcriptional regulator|nr:Rrf2 family transcriptional regulator [Gammaproteobacteria bacterium]